MNQTRIVFAGFMVKACLGQTGTQLHDDWYIDFHVSDNNTEGVFGLQMRQPSWLEFNIGSTGRTEGDDILLVHVDSGNEVVTDMHVNSSGDLEADTISGFNYDAPVPVNDIWDIDITALLDRGDAEDFVIPEEDEWSLGWSLCTTSADYQNVAADYTGVIKFNEAGAAHLAGLTASGLAALALMLSH